MVGIGKIFEDYYSTPGQMEYVEEYLAKDNNIILAINCDGIGLKDSKTAISMVGLPEEKKMRINRLIEEKEDFEMIDPWVEGDHMLFQMNQISTIALTSKNIFEIIDSVIHTEKDTLNLIDCTKVIEVVFFLEELVRKYQ